jgi:signal transduction histidine kinase
LENALKYSGARAKIILSFQPTDSNLEISVEDSGPGVPVDIRERIFDPFVRGKGQQNIDGAGIGLSLVRAIAQSHGGRATLMESELGGAKFILRIPR